MHALAYLVIAHADPTHLRRMVAALGQEADIYVHIDAKSDIARFRDVGSAGRVFFVEPRISVSWAGISQVDASLLMLRTALQSGKAYGHLVLLSGADYPIKTPGFIREFLAAKPGHQFMRYIDMRLSPEHYMRHINRRWFKEPLYRGRFSPIRLADKALRRAANMLAIPNHWPSATVPYFGSSWWALTSECAAHVLHCVAKRPDFYEANRYTLSADEHFFHTLVGNSPFASQATGLQAFEGRGTFRMANLHIIHPSLQKWYAIDDWQEIADSPRLFVRKVSTAASTPLLDRIDRELLA